MQFFVLGHKTRTVSLKNSHPFSVLGTVYSTPLAGSNGPNGAPPIAFLVAMSATQDFYNKDGHQLGPLFQATLPESNGVD